MRHYLNLFLSAMFVITNFNHTAVAGADCVNCTHSHNGLPNQVTALANVAETITHKTSKMKKSEYCDKFKNETAGVAIGALDDLGDEDIDYLTYNDCILTDDNNRHPPTFNAAEFPEVFNNHIYWIINHFNKRPNSLKTIFNAKNEKGDTLLDFIDKVHPNRDPSNVDLNKLIAYICNNGGEYTNGKSCSK